MPTKVGSRTYQRTSLSQGRTSPQNIGGGRGASCRWPIPAGIRRSPPACGSLPLIILIVLDKMPAAGPNGKLRELSYRPRRWPPVTQTAPGRYPPSRSGAGLTHGLL